MAFVRQLRVKRREAPFTAADCDPSLIVIWKSGPLLVAEVTFRDNVWLFCGPPAVVPTTFSGNVPGGVLRPVETVRVTGTGLPETGSTVADG